MNKFLLLILLFFSLQTKAIDSLANTKQKPITYSEKDIKTDRSQITPVQFRADFKSKYQSKEFQYEVKAQEKSWWDRFLEWLRQLFRDLFGLTDGVSSTAVDWTVNIIATLIVLIVVYLIVKSILNKEGQWIFGKSTTKKIISHDDIERNLKNIDFEKLINQTLKSNNHRLAIRYYYLWILKKMSEKSIIEWNVEKTNSDYLYEIKSDGLRKEFSYASYLYNYIWYGEFELDEVDYKNAIQAMEKTLKSI